MRDLYFFHDDNGTLVDYTLESRDYLRDPISLTFVAAEDYLIFGLYKPFYSVYAEFETLPANAQTLQFEYWNGTAWTPFVVRDFSKDFSRSGFIQWDRTLDDWAESAQNGIDGFYVRVSLSADDTFSVQGYNVVYADDIDLESEQRDIDDFRRKGDSSFIAYHVAARNEIIQTLRNGGYRTKKTNASLFENLTKWDLLDIDEFRAAAKFLALSKIMEDVSNAVDDKYYQRFKEYRRKYNESFKLAYQSLDLDDDGQVDTGEKVALRTVSFIKV